MFGPPLGSSQPTFGRLMAPSPEVPDSGPAPIGADPDPARGSGLCGYPDPRISPYWATRLRPTACVVECGRASASGSWF